MVVLLRRGEIRDGSHFIANNVHITYRELEVLMWIANGVSADEVAKRLNIKVQTVRNHLNNIMIKLGAKSRAHAVALSMYYGMLRDGNILDGAESSKYLWCLQCQRVYMRGKFKKVKGKKFVVNHVAYDGSYEGCPYEDCKGVAVLDAFDWNYFREWHMSYPEIPEKGVVYEYT